MLVSEDRLLIFYHCGITRIYRLDDLSVEQDTNDYVKEHFHQVKMEPGGYGIEWNGVTGCSARKLIKHGTEISVRYADFCHYTTNNILNTAEACDILNCTLFLARLRLHHQRRGL